MRVLKGYDYDDLLLIPKPSKVNSRDEVNLSVNLYDVLQLRVPIVASPMKGIISPEMIIGMSKLGGIGILHKFYKDKLQWQSDISKIKDYNFGVAVGLEEDNLYKKALDNGTKIICIDVANGYLDSVLNKVREIKNYMIDHGFLRQCLLMAGNVTTYSGAWRLYQNGAELIRVGIGSGGQCSTRETTGVGYPQLSAINDCYEKRDAWTVVADGGINKYGKATKALAMGAELIMLGSILGRTFESANDNGVIRGMASESFQEEYYDNVKEIKSVEGIETKVEKDISLEKLIKRLIGGIRSACTYLNANNLDELRKNAEWIETGSGTLK